MIHTSIFSNAQLADMFTTVFKQIGQWYLRDRYYYIRIRESGNVDVIQKRKLRTSLV